MSYKIYNTGLSSIIESRYLEGKLVNTIQNSNVLVNPTLKYIYGKKIIINSPEVRLDERLSLSNEVVSRFPYKNFKVEPYDLAKNKFRMSCKYNRFIMVLNPAIMDTDFYQIYGDLIEAQGFCLFKTDMKTNEQYNLFGYININFNLNDL